MSALLLVLQTTTAILGQSALGQSALGQSALGQSALGQSSPADPEAAPECPPGYYCEPAEGPAAGTPEGPVAPPPADATDEAETQPPTAADEAASTVQTPASGAPPPATPAPPERIVLEPTHPFEEAPIAPPIPRAWARWEIAARAGLAVFDSGAQRDAFMAAAGVAGRYRFVRFAAIELAADAATGTDYAGAERSELWIAPAVRLEASPFGVAPFFAAGPALSFAWVDDGREHRRFTYLAGAVSFGLAVPVSSSIRLELAWSSFFRARVPASGAPEYVDPDTGRTTNASGGALIRLGAGFRF